VKPLDESDPGQDERRAHEQSAENPPEQHAMLVLLGNREVVEDYEKNEKIIDAERKFEDVTCDELDGNLPALPEKNEHSEGCRQSQPHGTAGQRIAGADTTAAVEDAQVQHQHRDREKVKDDPEIDQAIAD
jgi:hypothetical protein